VIIIDIPQKSLDWIIERLWRLTASQAKGNITATGLLSKSEAALGNIDRMIAGHDAAREMIKNPSQFDDMDDWQIQQWIGHYTGQKFTGNMHTKRGNDFEPDAIAALASSIGGDISDVGMCVMGDNRGGVVSCSPDGLIYSGGKLVAGAEVKCPTLSTFYGWIAEGVLPSDHILQVHVSMAVCEVDTWHFGAYFRGKPIFHLPVRRDTFTDRIEKALGEFRDLYAERYGKVSDALAKLKNQQSDNILL
jgi:hypothetical protein